MPDVSVTIWGLKQIKKHFERCANVYPDLGFKDNMETAADAIELLEKQVPIAPLGHEHMYFCGACKYAIPRTDTYCPKCGRKVKWYEDN